MDCLPMKMKRKEIDRVNDEFSDFCLSSPVRKIRRLDLDLPPIMEEEEVNSTAAPVNEERAIVLFNPPPQHHYPRGQLFVDRNLISGFKNRFLNNGVLDDDHYDEEDEETKKDQAIVCWNPSPFQFLEAKGSVEEPRGVEIVELDGEDTMMEEADMDVDEEVSMPQTQQEVGGGGYQWQQQQVHCMVPQIPQTSSTPVSWFR